MLGGGVGGPRGGIEPTASNLNMWRPCFEENVGLSASVFYGGFRWSSENADVKELQEEPRLTSPHSWLPVGDGMFKNKSAKKWFDERIPHLSVRELVEKKTASRINCGFNFSLSLPSPLALSRCYQSATVNAPAVVSRLLITVKPLTCGSRTTWTSSATKRCLSFRVCHNNDHSYRW